MMPPYEFYGSPKDSGSSHSSDSSGSSGSSGSIDSSDSSGFSSSSGSTACPFGILVIKLLSAPGDIGLNIGVGFLSHVFGSGYEWLVPYLAWTGETIDGVYVQTLTFDLPAAWWDGAIITSATVSLMANWGPGEAGERAATAIIFYPAGAAGSAPYPLNPGPDFIYPADSPMFTLTVLDDGTYSISPPFP